MSQWSNNSQSQGGRPNYRTPAKPKKVNGCVIIADIGAATSKVTAEGTTLAQKTKQCISYALQHKIFLKEQDDFGIVLCGSETTQNRLFKEGKSHYKHINVLADMQLATWDLIKSVEEEMAKPTDCKGDWVDALGVALDLIQNRFDAGVLYEELRILVLTDFDQPVRSSTRTEDAYVTTLSEQGTLLFFINDEETLKSEFKNPSQIVAQRLISQLKGLGKFVPFNDLYDSAIVFSKRPKLGTAWNSTLDIGNEIKIPVVGYIKVRQGDSFFKWKTETSDESIVQRDTRYQTGSGENVADIDNKDVVDAYKYGNDFFPMEIDKDKSTTKCLSVLAFVDPVSSHLFMGNGTMYIYAGKADKKQDNNKCEQIAISAFIHAMHDMNKVALVRRVYGAGYKPALGILSPRIKHDYECLVYNEVPFADDYRQVQFSPIVNSKNNPTEEQLSAIDKLIDDFNLLKPNEFEELKPKEVVDLQEEHIRHSVGFKILHPDEPLPGILPHIKSNMEPLPSLLSGSKELLDRIKTLFPLEVLDRLRVNGSEAAKRALVPAASNPEEELENPSKKLRLSDSEALMGLSTLLGDSKVLKIGTVHPAEDYVSLRKKKSADEVDPEMERVMVSLLHDSLGTNATLMTKVGNCVRVYRQSAPAPEFNRWIRDFKQIVMDHHYETFWKKYIADEELGLVDVNPDEAHQFLLLLRASAGIEKIEDDDDDLADLI